LIDRICLKIKEIIHYIFHISIYHNNVILRGVPKLVYGKNIIFGKNVILNDAVFIHAKEGVSIGENTTLSYGTSVITESYVVDNYSMYKKKEHSGKKIVIGRNVWICANSLILPGVRIADNVIVGAGSVVVDDLMEEGALYAGNPARFIKKMEWKV
jgi:acetyltransferase-like isoleucine patch superfamily enzyme